MQTTGAVVLLEKLTSLYRPNQICRGKLDALRAHELWGRSQDSDATITNIDRRMTCVEALKSSSLANKRYICHRHTPGLLPKQLRLTP